MAGRRIDDHSSWISKDGKFPMESKMKREDSAEGAGRLADYADTSEKIKMAQEMGEKKAKAHAMKPGYRY